MESLVLKTLGRPDLHDAKVKPFSVWPLLHRGRPVLWRAAVAPGDPVEVRMGFADDDMASQFAAAAAGGLQLFGARLDPEAVEVRDAHHDLPQEQCFKLEFLSPLRFATPPLYRRSKPTYEFYPRPLSLFKSAVKHGRTLGLTKLGAPFLRWVYTYVALTDLGCHSRCVATVKLPGGGIARGFLGWALYRAYGKRRITDLRSWGGPVCGSAG
ncbi:CRISPR-associated protein, Cas6 family [Pyrobaculum islandicum DSM 4184]|uniref:CRISPR-associated protein, Cas6 family n=1 Tax=Pyrobaculum islandicum (strain DSM 4184 / JCM 9189 / GEO3) TaxID=384616 RepID=A1RVU7_PYRIL|nr:CRISPR system precrRNA processing endoribonuclease RAMP protein Cas6 [Pyrobaculum islandicum]ABL89079.1 CRISPR-associated protein, Cas6 family [Pyrobaculum islandicum DSM 4184]